MDITENDLPSIPIPKQIFQTHKSREYIKQNPDIKNALNSWRRFVPEFGYFFIQMNYVSIL